MKRFAVQAHKGQKYGTRGYDFHLNEVAEKTAELMDAWGITNPDERDIYLCVAFGHDLFEDTEATYPQIQEMFSTTIATGILIMTKGKNQSRADYISGMGQSEYACLVKIADSSRNLHHSVNARSQRRVDKYTANISELLVVWSEF
ncbi:MAG: hypothetical protein HRT61_09870 [Ekhidna sp.]|nr:hypothetical protein [Ekhidna sp.]